MTWNTIQWNEHKICVPNAWILVPVLPLCLLWPYAHWALVYLSVKQEYITHPTYLTGLLWWWNGIMNIYSKKNSSENMSCCPFLSKVRKMYLYLPLILNSITGLLSLLKNVWCLWFLFHSSLIPCPGRNVQKDNPILELKIFLIM